MFESAVVGGAMIVGLTGIVNSIVMFEVLGRKRGSSFLKSLHRLNRTRFLGHYLSLKLPVLSIDDVCIPQGS